MPSAGGVTAVRIAGDHHQSRRAASSGQQRCGDLRQAGAVSHSHRTRLVAGAHEAVVTQVESVAKTGTLALPMTPKTGAVEYRWMDVAIGAKPFTSPPLRRRTV